MMQIDAMNQQEGVGKTRPWPPGGRPPVQEPSSELPRMAPDLLRRSGRLRLPGRAARRPAGVTQHKGAVGYSYSYTEFLDKTCGWAKVLDYASGGKTHEAVFGKSEQQIYDDWKQYLKG